jgi:hypothetical protein
MTIIAAVSWSRQGGAPLNLAAQISRWTGDKVVAATIVERTWPPKADPIEDEYLRYVTSQASRSLDRVVSQLPGIPTSPRSFGPAARKTATRRRQHGRCERRQARANPLE